MSHDQHAESFIAAFFRALDLRQIHACEEALTQLERLAQAQPRYLAWCAYLAGILANERDHDWAAAERIFRRLLNDEMDPPLKGRVLLALGRSYEYQGRWPDAIETYEQSLTVFARLNQPFEQAKAWKQIALALMSGFDQGDFNADALERAHAYCRRALGALASFSDATPDIAWLEGSIWNALGLIYRNLGSWSQAIDCYRHDLAICEKLGDQHGIGISLLNLGEIYQKLGPDRWPDALAAYHQALEAICAFKDRYLESDVLANLAFLHQEMGAYDTALDYYCQAIAVIETLRAAVSSEEARSGFFATTIDTYANAVLLCVTMGRVAQAFDYVERARARAFFDTLAAREPARSRPVEATILTLAQVQAALPADALLLAYFTTGLIESPNEPSAPPGVQRHRFPPPHTLIFAVTHATAQVYDAGLAPNALRPRRLDSVVERHFLQPAIRRTLYERLLAPVAVLLGGKRQLYLLPHGPLHYVPFQALLAPDGDTLLREGGPQLVYAPSATILFSHEVHGQRHKLTSEPAADARRTLLALGYNGDATARLRFAEDEAQQIVQIWDGSSFIGPEPKKPALYARAGDYRLLHFSCHGNFDPETPLASSLHLAPGEHLTALDVLDNLRLHCDLVTLSACESGLSRVRRGDELIGLVRAFMYAGAPALVCTLWRVDERSTRLLMEHFYHEIQRGARPAAALQRAQLALRTMTRKQAREALLRRMTHELLPESPPYDGTSISVPTAQSRPPRAFPHGGTTQADTGPGADSLLHGNDDEAVFADPYYWAAFVLIGE